MNTWTCGSIHRLKYRGWSLNTLKCFHWSLICWSRQGTQRFLNRTGGLVAEWSAGSLQSCAIPQGFLPLWNISFRSVPRICILTPAHTLCHWTPKLFSHDAACAHALVAPRHILAWSISTLHRLCKIHFLVGCDGYQICVRLDYCPAWATGPCVQPSSSKTTFS